MKTIVKHNHEKADREVAKMLETWDIVRCAYCGKKISMLDAKMVRNGQSFICKDGH